MANIPQTHQLEQALLEYSDRVIFHQVDQRLFAHGKRHRYPTNSQLSGLFQMARGVQSPQVLFAQNAQDNSFQNFLEGRKELAQRRRKNDDEQFFSMIGETLFGQHELMLRRAASSLLKELYQGSGMEASSAERSYCQVFLFQEWIKHFFLKTKYLSQMQANQRQSNKKPFNQKPSQRRR